MPLNPTFSVTPLNPRTSLYDYGKSIWKHYGALMCYGDFMSAWVYQRLLDQYNQDKAVLRYSPYPQSTTFPSKWYEYSVARLYFITDAGIDNQYLLIYHVSGGGGAKAAFFLNGNHLRTETVSGEEYIAILADCPPSQTWWNAYIFLIDGGYLELKGIECYIL